MITSALAIITTFFTNIFKWALDGLLWMFKFVFFVLVDGILTVITSFFSALNLANLLGTYVADWSGLPSQMGYVIGVTQIPACITVIMGAIGIRVLINLIPSWATRV